MDTKDKIITLVHLKRKLPGYRRKKKKITFTNGCFDLIHAGHVAYLEKAKKAGRVLIVGLNSDASVRKIKGKKRPVVKERARARVLAALACVDHVVMFGEPTPLRLIKAIKPDVLIKGADWKKNEVVGADVVRDHGGRVELIKYVSGFSTTDMINRIIETCKE